MRKVEDVVKDILVLMLEPGKRDVVKDTIKTKRLIEILEQDRMEIINDMYQYFQEESF